MLNKEELNYLVMLVVKDQRAIRAYRENNQFEEANKQNDIRESLINKLNAMYDDLDK